MEQKHVYYYYRHQGDIILDIGHAYNYTGIEDNTINYIKLYTAVHVGNINFFRMHWELGSMTLD